MQLYHGTSIFGDVALVIGGRSVGVCLSCGCRSDPLDEIEC